MRGRSLSARVPSASNERLLTGRVEGSQLVTRTTTKVRGRVTAISIVHADGSESQILRLPSGTALCGFDDDDDGHLEDPWTSVPVERDSSEFRLTVVDRR